MGDFEQTVRDFEAGLTALGSSGQDEANGRPTGSELYDEIPEMELASELLEAQGDQEMEQFFGNLLKKAAGALRSPVGQALTGVLKTVAKAALPQVGAAIGNRIAPGVGGAIGSKLASGAGQVLGLEMEGMSPQDQEFEAARRMVRLATVAGREATQLPPGLAPSKAAAAALHAAAQKVAPGLVRNVSQVGLGPAASVFGGEPRDSWRGLVTGSSSTGYPGRGHSGRWVKRGDQIILLGV
jgi:hypothetical protein